MHADDLADKPKNLRRANAQHRWRLRLARRNLWWVIPITVVPLAVVVGSFWRPMPGWLRVTSWVFLVSGALTLFELWIEIAYHSRRIVPEDGQSTAGP